MKEREMPRFRNHYEKVNMNTWKRAEHCRSFRKYLNPEYRITVPMDITEFRKAVRERGWSLTLSMNYAVAHCANQIEEFRYRFVDGEPVLFDRVDTSFTYLNKETELFRTIIAPLTGSMEEYVQNAARIAASQDTYFQQVMPPDVFQLTAMPWFTFTQCTHADEGGERIGIPLFEWGRSERREGREVMPFTTHVHHSFVDAVHVGRMVNLLQEYLTEF